MNLGSFARVFLVSCCVLPYSLWAAPASEEARLCQAANAPFKTSKVLPLKKTTVAAVQSYKNLWKSFCANDKAVTLAAIADAADRLNIDFKKAVRSAETEDLEGLDGYLSKLPNVLPLFSGTASSEGQDADMDLTPLSQFVAKRGQEEDKAFFANLAWFHQEGQGDPWIMQTSDVGFCWKFKAHAWAKSLQNFEEARSFKTKIYRALIQNSEESLIRNLQNMDRDGLATCDCESKDAVQKQLLSLQDATEKKPALQSLNKAIKDRLKSFSKIEFHASSECTVDPYLLQGETTIVGFKLENSSKKVALVKSEQPPYYQYRFGKLDHVELEFPAARAESWKAFTFSQTGARTSLVFTNGAFSYTLYEEAAGIGILVKNLKTGQESSLKGDIRTREGSLASLQNDVRFKPLPKEVAMKTTQKAYCQFVEIPGEKPSIEVISVQTITEGLPPELMQMLNREGETAFQTRKTELEKQGKQPLKGKRVSSKDCSGLNRDQIVALAPKDASENTERLYFTRLGGKIVSLMSAGYSDSGVHPTGGTDNRKYFRVADGKEVTRDKLFTAEGLKKMDKAVRKALECKPNGEDEEDLSGPCTQFSGVDTQGHFEAGADGRINIAFSDLEISGHAEWNPDSIMSFSAQEFDSFVR